MGTSSTIEIFYPTFKNRDVFEHSINSCLEQDYKDILIHVYDDSGSDCHEIYDLVEQIDDTRLVYHRNKFNIGTWPNCAQIIDHMKTTEFSIFLAADVGLEKRSLSVMMTEMQKRKSQVIHPSSYLFDYEEKNGVNLASKKYFGVTNQVCEQETVSGIEQIEEYFSDCNISGEYNNFSFYSSLIHSPVLRSLSQDYLAFRFHGSEQFLSMELAINSTYVTRIGHPCLHTIIGAPRFGDTERPRDFYTRIETIVACQRFLKKYDLMLRRHIPSGTRLHKSQIDKCHFFKKNYSGYEDLIEDILEELGQA